MSVFYRSQSIIPAASEVLKEALATDPKTVADHQKKVLEMAQQVNNRVTGGFAWGRFGAAVIFLMFLLGAGIYTSQHTEMKEWSVVLLHTFEVAIGGVVGIVIGEKTANT